MRLQLSKVRWLAMCAAALGMSTTLCSSVRAQPVVQIDTRGSIYDDSDATTIITATGAARATIAELVTVKGRYLADIITTASVDVVSAATPSFEEVRHEGEGGLGYADGTNTASATYIYSTENDWFSHTMAAGLGRDFFQHQLTLGLGGSAVLNTVGRQDDDNFEEKLNIGAGTVSMSLIATRDDLISLAYSFIYSGGYQSSPYRFSYLQDPSGSGLVIGPPETHPDTRARHALAMRYNRYLFRDSALRSHVRGYVDDWGVKSVTFGTEFVVGFPPLELGLRVRGYAQSKASFYKSVYTAPKRYMTADRELGAFIDGFVGGKVGIRQFVGSFLHTFKAEVRFDAFGFKYSDFPRLPKRAGMIGEAGLGASF
jgi:hypothetical protein